MRSKIVGLVATAFSLGVVQGASAADMPTKAPMAAPAYTWTGWYIGLNAGGNWGKTDDPMTILNSNLVFTTGFDAAGGQGVNTNGFTGGVQGGYNYQTGNWLLGLEADFEYFRSAGSQTLVFPTPNGPGFTSTLSKSLSTDWLFTARPRLGFVSGNWLFYGTGGLAVTNLKASWTYSDTAGETSNASLSNTKVGWTAGGGVEYALPGNWMIGGEYLYVKFGSVSTTVPFSLAPLGVTNSADLASNIVRFRLNKKF